MTTNTRDRRIQYLLDPRRRSVIRTLTDPLKDAPLRVRRLGLGPSLVLWHYQGHRNFVRLLGDWLFREWGMIGPEAVPQGLDPFLDRLQQFDEETPALRSAIEREAEELFQTAKLLAGALKGDENA